MTDNVKYVQNLMCWLLDLLESTKNIFNWTSPNKTWPIYILVVVIWIITVIIPGRIIILTVGLYEFLFVFLPIPDGKETIVRLSNLIASIPNDDDLDQIYAEEKKKRLTVKRSEWKLIEKTRKIELSLPVFWKGTVRLKASGSTNQSGSNIDWAESYLLIQCRRLVWWKSEEALDLGKVLFVNMKLRR
jgi:hypothetical protein